MNDHRPCERKCAPQPVGCGLWKHHSRFRSRLRKMPHGTRWHFDPVCLDCQQKERNEEKNKDRPRAIIYGRAQVAAHKAGVNTEFFWTQMNYRRLVPIMRGMMSEEGGCLNCGHDFLNERDIQIEHIAPARNLQDWARLHARNLHFFCGACNRRKSNKEHERWLDEQEGARLSNLDDSERPVDDIDPDPQLSLGF